MRRTPSQTVVTARDVGRWAICGLLLVVILTAVFYFVPGNPDAPAGRDAHHFGRSVGGAVVVTVTFGFMIRFILPTKWRR